MNTEDTKVIYETQWVAKDSDKEYPHGWGFSAPLVEFPQEYDPVLCAEICRRKLSNDEFECINATAKKVLVYAHEITWEFEEWSEKAVGEAFIKGVDNNGISFEATGIMGSGEIVEVCDIEIVSEPLK